MKKPSSDNDSALILGAALCQVFFPGTEIAQQTKQQAMTRARQIAEQHAGEVMNRFLPQQQQPTPQPKTVNWNPEKGIYE